MSNFNKLLLTELRIVEGTGEYGVEGVNASNVEQALVENENLKALGYVLTEDSVVNLAKDYANNNPFFNKPLTPLYERILEWEPSIEVSPMYPNFPIQVLEMDEEEFRADQIAHYITTYGLESVGVNVREGWLPQTENIDERIEDVQVANLKTLEYLSPVEVDKKVIDEIIGKRERLLPGELELAKAVMLRTNEIIEDVPFKENIGKIFGDVLLSGTLQEIYSTLDSLANVVKHPGDVLDLIEYMVVKNKYKHFKTSVKRGLVELIESFELNEIEENLASNRWSNKFLGKGGKPRKINRNIALIDYLSFNRFSKRDGVKKIVDRLKSGKLMSWNQKVEQAYSNNDGQKVLKLLSQRPGVLFRQVNRLIKLGLPSEQISSVLKEKASELKTQSIVSALNNFEGDEEVVDVFTKTLINNLKGKDLSDVFKGKKVYIDEKEVDFMRSKIAITDKFEDGGYIGNGIAVRIPEKAEFLRFFTYWNDDNRIDIDLHGVTLNDKGETSHVGWNSRYKDQSLVHSGDITHSDAAEYIDLDLNKAREEGVLRVQFNINSYTGVHFSRIDTVFTGLMALSEMGQKVDLFDPKNVLFRHDLDSKSMAVDYGIIDLENNLMYIDGKLSHYHNNAEISEIKDPALSMKVYIGLLALTQGATLTNEEEADLILGLAKEDKENYISLIDKNFFLD